MTGKQDMRTLREKIETVFRNHADDSQDSQSRIIEEIIEQLGVYHKELEYQNEELRRIQNELEKNQRYFFSIFDEAPVGYAICTRDGTILKANKTLVSMLNLDFTDLVKRRFEELVTEDSQDDFYLYLRKLNSVGSQVRISLKMYYHNKPKEFSLISSVYNDGTEDFIRIAVV